jgi:hypothetical protein
MRIRGPRPCPAAHTGEHPILAQFFPEGSHGYIRVSIFLVFLFNSGSWCHAGHLVIKESSNIKLG